MKRTIIFLAAALLATTAGAQDAGSAREGGRWEIGVGASAMQFSRVSFAGFSTTDAGHNVSMRLKHSVFGGNLSLVRSLSDKWAADFQTTVGAGDSKPFALGGLGVQWRLGSYFRSRQIDPYVRVGGNYLYKGFDMLYGGTLDGMEWNMTDNGGGSANAHHLFAASAGVGVNMWLNRRFGIGLQGDYLLMPRRGVANSMQGTVRLMWRLGKRPALPAPDAAIPVTAPAERIVEVEKIVERRVEVPVERVVNLNELLSGIYFDYDSHEVKPEYGETLDGVRDILLENTSNRYLISGFTDSHGSAEYNLRLSERRVNAIRDALVSRGVPAQMIKTCGQGEKISILPPDADDRARMGDRKVTIEQITNREYWDAL